jgi:hypothetical protein
MNRPTRNTLFGCVLCLILALSGCVGESRHEAMGACQMAYLALSPEKRPEQGWRYTVPCMETHGFRLSLGGSACSISDEPGANPYCYKPRSTSNWLRSILSD